MNKKARFQRWTPNRLRLILGASFLLLALPTLILSYQAREQIKWESLYQNRALAEELSNQIDYQLQSIINQEEKRQSNEYRFLLSQQENDQRYQRRSPLSELASLDTIPGLLGYFEINEKGEFQTPLLPSLTETNQTYSEFGLSENELEQRKRQSQNLYNLLTENHLLESKPATAQPVQAANDTKISEKKERAESPQNLDAGVAKKANVQQKFDDLALNQSKRYSPKKQLGNVEELKLERSFAFAERQRQEVQTPPSKRKPAAPAPAQTANALLESADAIASDAEAEFSASMEPTQAITLFEGINPPFELAFLDSGHMVLYRKLWINDQPIVQGMALEQERFLQNTVESLFNNSILSQHSNLVVAFQGNVVQIFSGIRYNRYPLSFEGISAENVEGTLLLQQKLTPPFDKVQLIYSANQLPMGPGGQVITWVSVLLVALLIIIFSALYKLGIKQIHLHQQQQNFIASVSHELKTPLTSIRMFSEMLKEGWASAEKQMEYYDFISDESERLSRLITNVLQLARMERQDLQLNIKPVQLDTAVDLIQSRLQSQIQASDFELQLNTPQTPTNKNMNVDCDALMQILMNLVDNSIKFSKSAIKRNIDVTISENHQCIQISVRDYGPGIPPKQLKKVFNLFYRVGNELTRSAQGTGIGLALVQQLTAAMGGSVSVENRSPGVEFTLQFPVHNP